MDPSTFIKSLQDQLILDYVFISSISVLLYDYILTFGLEIEHIWSARWGYSKVLFVLVRYITLASVCVIIWNQLALNTSISACQSIGPVTYWLSFVKSIIVEPILCLRTWAIWDRDSTVAATLIITMLVFIGFGCFLNVQITRTVQYLPSPFPGFRGCLAGGAGSLAPLLETYTLFFAVEAVLFILVVMSAYRLYRAGRNTHLTYIIHRDAIVFYVYMLILSGANLIILHTASIDYQMVLVSFMDSLHVVFTTRIILNIRSITSNREMHTSYPEFETFNNAPLQFAARIPLQDLTISDDPTETTYRDSGDLTTGTP